MNISRATEINDALYVDGVLIEPKVYIVIVNWNGWKDTVECIGSILENNYSNYQIVVCDNFSTDNSMENMLKWAESNGINFALKNEVNCNSKLNIL